MKNVHTNSSPITIARKHLSKIQLENVDILYQSVIEGEWFILICKVIRTEVHKKKGR